MEQEPLSLPEPEAEGQRPRTYNTLSECIRAQYSPREAGQIAVILTSPMSEWEITVNGQPIHRVEEFQDFIRKI